MTKIILIVSFLILPIYSSAQELKESDLEKLLLLQGKVETYYSKGFETKAKYFQELVQDAVIFYENKLQDTFDIKLFVLSKSDWKIFVGGPYLLPEFAKNPDRIMMGINELFIIELPEGETLYGMNEVFFWDFISIHELGHYISKQNKVKSIRWTSEFFADYLMIGFMLEKIPNFQQSSSTSTLFKFLPFKYKSIEDFQRNYSRIDPLNYSMYQAKFQELAFSIFKKRGWDFMFEYIERFKNVSPPPNKNNLVELTFSEFQEMEPEIFNKWLVGMRKTYHSSLILCILIILVCTIRLIDNSNYIFIHAGLSTKKKYKIFGVPILLIFSKLKNFENLKTGTKLKLIIALRPVMYLCVILIILLLILHH